MSKKFIYSGSISWNTIIILYVDIVTINMITHQAM